QPCWESGFQQDPGTGSNAARQPDSCIGTSMFWQDFLPRNLTVSNTIAADAWGAGGCLGSPGVRSGGITVSGRMICPTCGAEYDAGELFCGRDGSRLQPLEEADVVHGAPAPTSSTGRTGYTDTAASTGRTSWVVEANIGDMLSRGWELFKADYMKYIGVTLLMAIPSLIPAVQLDRKST